VRLQLANEELRAHLDSGLATRASPEAQQLIDAMQAGGGGGVGGGGGDALRRSESVEHLVQDLQRKCDMNLRLQMALDDLRFQRELDLDTIQRLQQQAEALRQKNERLAAAQNIGLGSTGSLAAVAAAAAAGEGGLSEGDRQLHSHFLKLRAAVEKLRARNEQLRRQEEYHLNLVENKQNHIRVLEEALHESNAVSRRKQVEHAEQLERLQAEVDELRRLLGAVGEGAAVAPGAAGGSRIVVPLQNQRKSWFGGLFSNASAGK
jgi:hypothetical protein